RNEHGGVVAHAAHRLLAGADGEERVADADDGLVRVVGVNVEAAAGEQLRQDVAGRRDALAGSTADGDCEVDVRHGPSGLLRGSSSLRRRPNRTAPVRAGRTLMGPGDRSQPYRTARWAAVRHSVAILALCVQFRAIAK